MDRENLYHLSRDSSYPHKNGSRSVSFQKPESIAMCRNKEKTRPVKRVVESLKRTYLEVSMATTDLGRRSWKSACWWLNH